MSFYALFPLSTQRNSSSAQIVHRHGLSCNEASHLTRCQRLKYFHRDTPSFVSSHKRRLLEDPFILQNCSVDSTPPFQGDVWTQKRAKGMGNIYPEDCSLLFIEPIWYAWPHRRRTRSLSVDHGGIFTDKRHWRHLVDVTRISVQASRFPFSLLGVTDLRDRRCCMKLR